MKDIPHQVRLPLQASFEVVVQGIRIRFGRSLVTMFGVVLGVAFLMSILTSSILKTGVADETGRRQETSRMVNFIEAETGPVSARTIAVIESGQPDEMEARLLSALEAGGAELRRMEKPEGARGASAVLVVGSAPLPQIDWAGVLAGADERVVASSRWIDDIPSDATLVRLTREADPGEKAAAEQEARKQRARSIWIVAIALLVTIMGISNALLMSVTERFREIGTMKCLGALSQFIRQVFLVESALIGCVGSLIGALFGFLFAVLIYAVSYGPARVFTSLAWLESGGAFLICVLGGIACAVLAALYPANVAARMVPAVALRSNV